MNCIIIFAIVGLSTFNCCSTKQLPSFIEKCKRADPAGLNKCMQQRIHELIPKLAQGFPEMKLPPLEPLRVPKLEVHTGNGQSVAFDAVLKDLSVEGASQLQIKDVNFDLENKHIFLDFSIPKLHVKGPYTIKGKVLLLQLDSQGVMDMDITDVHSTAHMNISIVTKNSKEYIDLGTDFKVTRKLGKVTVNFGNLFKDNPQLTETTNKAINDNIKEIGKEIKPLLDESVHFLVVGILVPFFAEFSLDELFD